MGAVRSSAEIAEKFLSTKRFALEQSKHLFHLAPHALSMVIIAAHASHITDVVTHISLGQLVLAGTMFALWYSSKSGSEEL